MSAVAVIWRRGDELTTSELYRLLELRIDVFVVEQECAYHETDGRDLLDTTWHGWTDTADGDVAAAIRVLGDEEPWRIGRVVTRPDHRGRGLAALLVKQGHDRAGTDGSVLDAQSYLVEWYRTLGWTVAGAEFIEDGIAHIPMKRDSGPVERD